MTNVHHLNLATAKRAERSFEGLEEKLRDRMKGLNFEFDHPLQQKIRETIISTAEKAAEASPKKDARNMEFISRLMLQLVQVLSFDFYRDIVDRLAAIDREDDYDEFGLDQELLKRVKPIFDFLYYHYWRVRVTGIHHVPAQGPAIIVANHSGTLPYDGAMIKNAILNEHPVRCDARFLVEDFVYHFPFLGTLMSRIGGVRASQENAERLLRKGHVVIVFPEGVKGIGKRFKDRYELQRFGRGGFIKLALRTGAPIIPVAVVGAEEIHPLIYKSRILAKPLGIPYLPVTPTLPWLGLLGLVPLPSKWSIQFGKPIHVDQDEHHKQTESLYIHQMSEKVRTKIQEMIDAGLKKRKSVWFG